MIISFSSEIVLSCGEYPFTALKIIFSKLPVMLHQIGGRALEALKWICKEWKIECELRLWSGVDGDRLKAHYGNDQGQKV